MPNRKIVEELTEKLKPILRDGVEVKSATLLQAYATFAAMGQVGEESLLAAYERLYESNASLEFATVPISQNCNEAAVLEAFQEFRRYSTEDFLRFIVSDLVTDASALMLFYYYELGSNICILTHQLIQVRRLLYSTDDYTDMELSDEHEVGEDNPNDSVLLRLYKRYCGLETNTAVRLDSGRFEKLYRCVNVFPIRFEEQMIRPIGYKRDELNRALDILYNQLELSRRQQIELCYRFYVENRQAKRFQSEEMLYRFFKLKDSLERKKLFSAALSLLAAIPPADALAAISIKRRTHDNGGNSFSERTFSPNDVPLENSLIYPLFTSSVGPVVQDAERQKGITIVLPSVFFVLKWLSDPALTEQKTCFVLRSSYESGVLQYHFSEGTYGQANLNVVTFMDLASWKDSLRSGRQSLEGGKLLAFFCGISTEEQSEIYRLLYAEVEHMELFLLLGSYTFERSRSPFVAALGDPRLRFRSIELLPQGINNSAVPRRKMLVIAELLSHPPQSREFVSITADTLNLDLKTQAVVRGMMKPVEVDPTELSSLDTTIRDLFWRTLLIRDGSGRQRNPPFSVLFTPDLTIWCSKSYPKKNLNRPRLEAYFCTVAPLKKAESGFLDRGEVLPLTRKRVSRLTDCETPQWLLEEYPFSYVHQRYSKFKLELGEVSISIREEVIEYYTDVFSGENIAVKTFWYLYPNLEDLFSAQEYGLLSDMAMKTEIGQLRLQELTSEDVEQILENSFPEDSSESLYRRFVILSKVVGKAVDYGYCGENPLAQTILDNKKRDKLFSQVRKALTKKHFTRNEFRSVYRQAVERLHQGQIEYIGVLIRLLTGLSSNVVCALKWKDLLPVEDYGIQKLAVIRQTTNDGGAYRGFESMEDYLCFPCSDLLTAHLGEVMEATKELYRSFTDFGEWPIVRRSEDANHRNGGRQIFVPRELERLCKGLIRELDLPEHIITVPDQNDGTKETNLNAYGGDFFRENFRYWTLSYGGMTNDETAYLIGNVPETTFGRFYCDYINDASQYLLYVKLRRLDGLLAGDEQDVVIRSRLDANSGRKHICTGASPTMIQLQFIPPSDADVELSINSKHGVSLLVAHVNEKGRLT